MSDIDHYQEALDNEWDACDIETDELTQLRAKVTELERDRDEWKAVYTAAKAQQESAEPVALPSKLAVFNRPEGHPQQSEEELSKERQFADGRNAAIEEIAKLGNLYTTPPTAAAAVAAFKAKVLEACEQLHSEMPNEFGMASVCANAIQALPADDTSLRGICETVLEEWELSPTSSHSDIVDRVLKVK